MQVHSPAFVNTKMFVQPNDATSVSADTFTREAVRRIGFERRAVPCAQHAMLECAPTHAYASPAMPASGSCLGLPPIYIIYRCGARAHRTFILRASTRSYILHGCSAACGFCLGLC